MKDGLNHGFDGLTDDTDVAAPEPKPAPSVQSQNPWQSVIQTPSGYKQTEVAVIPKDWEVKSFAETGHFRTGPLGTSLTCGRSSASTLKHKLHGR